MEKLSDELLFALVKYLDHKKIYIEDVGAEVCSFIHLYYSSLIKTRPKTESSKEVLAFMLVNLLKTVSALLADREVVDIILKTYPEMVVVVEKIGNEMETNRETDEPVN